LSEPVDDAETIAATSRKLLDGTELLNKLIRLLGVGISNFGDQLPKGNQNKDKGQLGLFEY
jgi:DNA polymerase-4